MNGEMASGKDKLSNSLSKLSAYLESDEGKESARKYFEDIRNKELMGKSQLKRFHGKVGKDKEKLVAFIEKVIAKYESKEYGDRELYVYGREPMTELYWFLLSYGMKHGIKVTKRNAKQYEKYLNMFTSEACELAGYIFQRMDGQGSVVRVDKIES
jgi:hypothetical protein